MHSVEVDRIFVPLVSIPIRQLMTYKKRTSVYLLYGFKRLFN